MKYSVNKTNRKTCRHDPDYRAQLGYRLKSARCSMGWSIADAAKYFQVTERTWHNWESGAHRIPFAVYKLCRVLARLELPGDAWAGWSFQGATLVTPEGRHIEPRDSSWWSLMVRNAQSFSAAYKEAARLRLLLADLNAASETDRDSREAAAVAGTLAAGLVPSKTKRKTNNSSRHQNDIIIESWPTLYDYQTPLTPLHAPKPTTSESALTPSFVSPWMPICGVRLTYQRPKLGPHLPQPGQAKSHLKQSINQNPNANPSPQSLPEPKSRQHTNGAKPNANASLIVPSARPAKAAKPAKLASASRGTA
jgi:DNA-binding transcriptional regulator YiaG